PTKIYVKPVLKALHAAKIAGMAHITGGGFVENIPRMLPEGLGVEIDYGSWPIPYVFDFLEEQGKLDRKEMFEVFNMGIGFVLAVEPEDMNKVIEAIENEGEKAFVIGRVKEGTGVEFAGGTFA
ncbi:AIR synthase-related protein, partial [Priestia megaterium]